MINKKFSAFFCMILLFAIGFISAAAIEDSLHLNVQVRDSSGNILTGTYKFDFNISTTSSCDAIVYNSTTTAATDARGIVSYYLENLNIDFNSQYYLCYYRDGTLKSASKIVRTPYSFNSKYLAGYAETYFMPINTTATGTFSRVSVNSSAFLDDYDSSYFMPLNTSVTGTFDFNSGWQAGGLTIQGGSIYAQAGYFYNISSLEVHQLEINGSLFPYPGYSNTFDLGNSSLLWRHLWLAGNANISGTLTTKTIVSYDWTNISHILLYNHTLSTFNAFNSTWDNRYLIADVSTALSNNITSVNTTRNIQELLNSTGIYTQGSLVNTTANIQALLNGTSLWLDSLNVTGTSYLGALIISADNISTNNIMSVNSTPTFSGNITFRNYSNEFMRITGDGNVGIGTASPQRSLDVNQSFSIFGRPGGFSGGNEIMLRGINNYTTTNLGAWHISIRPDVGVGSSINNSDLKFVRFYPDATYKDVSFQLEGSTGNAFFANNVGIGTASPSQKLEVAGNLNLSSGGNITIGSGTTSLNSSIYFASGNGPNSRTWSVGTRYGTSTASPNFGFTIRDETGGVDRFHIDWSTGNVGIGTTNPGQLLTLSATDSDNSRLRIQSTSFGYNIWRNNTNGFLSFQGDQSGFTGYDFLSDDDSHLVTIIDNGNVGIGTTSPSKPLEVVGAIKISNSTSSAGPDVRTIGSDANWGILIRGDAGNTATFGVTNSTNTALFVIKNSGDSYFQNGNIGIGTTTPATMLNLHGSTAGFMLSNGGTAIDTTPNVGTSTDGYSLQYNRNTGEIAHMGFSTTGSTFQTFYTQTGGAASSEKMRIDSLGNVGIGTTSPTAKLHLGTVGLNRGIAVGLWSDMSADGGGRGLFGGNMYLNYSNNLFYYSNTHATIGAMGFAVNYPAANQASVITSGTTSSTVNTAFTPTVIATFDDSGNVGIGTTSPAVTFVVNNGSGTLSSSFSLQNTTAIFAGKSPVVGNVGNRVLLTVDNNLDYGAYIGSKLISAGAVGLVLGVKHGTTNDALTIDNNGKVGIGTTTPSATLQVVGNLTVSGNVTLGSGGISSNVTGVDCVTFRTGGKICAA